VFRWKVLMEKQAEAELLLLLNSKKITKEDIKVILKWVADMEEFGPEFISKSLEWHDHQLDRKWAGFRASAFSHSGRIIYRLIDEKVIVEVIRVTLDHNYK